MLQGLRRRWAAFEESGPLATEVHCEWPRAVAVAEVEVSGAPRTEQRPVPRVERTPGGGWRCEGEGFVAEQVSRGGPVRLAGRAGLAALESVLRLLLAREVHASGGLLVHGVAVAEGRAGLFTGPSGAGKSTLGALCHPSPRRLSDELVAVLPDGESFRAWATPWNVGAPADAELAMVGVLEHTPGAVMTEAPGAELARVLLTNCLLPDDSAEARAEAFRHAAALVQRVRAVRLGFSLDRGVAALLAASLR